ncbi:phosphorylase family protein [Sabulicella glaciei]|uniref:Nucleoside phosphorylase n=1 Tax=Sabulicella glaciei TaxID=2984948 RepID=A0ABT3NS69_9PROT|nr:nucleoside phosphorylase [Roseococcus sp. MDT2-1-1]MCW8085004.1 nucleoside phosphorylase [Roseococcus sp. MDT2-1-1]
MPPLLPSGCLLVCGLRAEAALLPRVRAVHAGGDRARLDAALDRETPTAILSFGLAGGLDPALPPGTLLIAAGLWGEGSADAGWSLRLAAATGAVPALLVGGAEAVVTPAAKAALRAQTGAAAVDMESAIALRHALRRGIPFAALRAVGDPADAGVPPSALAGMTPEGDVAPGRVLLSLLRRPGDLPGLLRVARHSGTAMKRLRLAARALTA